MRTKRTLGGLTVIGCVLAVTALPATAGQAVSAGPAGRVSYGRPTGTYVALGDSFTAGPLIPPTRGRPAGCRRSGRNYPALVAARSRFAGFTDVSCSGAQTRHMTAPQSVPGGRNPAQLDALTADTTLVTIGIGGNDAGFGTMSVDCALVGVIDLDGAPCKAILGRQLERQVAATAPKVAAILAEVRRRAPKARVLVVGYLRLMPERGGCWPMVPYALGDVRFLDQVERSLNGLLQREAAAAGAEFVDTYRDGAGHDMCAPPRDKWVEGVLITAPAAPVHPNAAGMRAVADRVMALLGTSRARSRGLAE